MHDLMGDKMHRGVNGQLIRRFRSPAAAGAGQLKQREKIGQVAAQYGVTFV
jgi:hypothetical protein